MRDSPFDRLAPFIQEYIYRHKWRRLRDIQAAAIPAILDGRDHILICSATASGKTEAALLPILTQLHEDPPSSIGVLYIGPLKALINDQFARLDHLLEVSDIPAQSWHGDVAQSKKQRFLRRARGILQITPESLEAMLMRRHHELGRLFGDLRYVVIDEAHAFIGTDRGVQVICQLERLARLQEKPARRFGLSATLGEPQLAMDWLRGRSPLPVARIDSRQSSSIQLGLEYFLRPGSERKSHASTPEWQSDDSLLANDDDYYSHIYAMSQRERKTLIFANSRGAVENIGLNLRRIASRKRQTGIYHVHHGSIAAPLRESAEAAMKAESQPACVAATVTLELGIDLGQLDQVLQVDAAPSVASFVQRLGRSGRREGAASRLFFYSTECQNQAKHFGEDIPWNLLQTLASVQLYLEEKWIEPPKLQRLPLSLLYHQTMSALYAHAGLRPPRLAQQVLSLSPFQHVRGEQYQALLRHLLEIEHLERDERGRLMIGVGAEKLVNDYRFYAVFRAEEEYRVRHRSREIGTIQAAPQIDATLVLAGYVWRVLTVDEARRVIDVARARGPQIPPWRGNGVPIHGRVMRKMRQILLSDNDFHFIGKRAKKRLAIARSAAQRTGLAEQSILPLAPGRFLLFPWVGTPALNTLCLLLRQAGLGLKQNAPYFVIVETGAESREELTSALQSLRHSPPAASELAEQAAPEALLIGKYDEFAPEALLREAYSVDQLDIPGALDCIGQLRADAMPGESEREPPPA